MKLRATFFTLFALFPSLASSATCGSITETTGKVEVLRPKTDDEFKPVSVPVKAPFEFLCNDVIVTSAGARAKVTLSNGIIAMSPKTSIFVETVLKGTSTPNMVNLASGKIRVFYKADHDSQFTIKTTTAMINVRGADFFVAFDSTNTVTTQATLNGEVEVVQLVTTQKVFVKSGEEVKVVNADQGVEKNRLSDETKAKFSDPLLIKPVQKETIMQIRQTSPLVKSDSEFMSPEALTVLGSPEKWVAPLDEIPDN